MLASTWREQFGRQAAERRVGPQHVRHGARGAVDALRLGRGATRRERVLQQQEAAVSYQRVAPRALVLVARCDAVQCRGNVDAVEALCVLLDQAQHGLAVIRVDDLSVNLLVERELGPLTRCRRHRQSTATANGLRVL
jgi:hypothetical protein